MTTTSRKYRIRQNGMYLSCVGYTRTYWTLDIQRAKIWTCKPHSVFAKIVRMEPNLLGKVELVEVEVVVSETELRSAKMITKLTSAHKKRLFAVLSPRDIVKGTQGE